MSAGYQTVLWNPFKRRYDLALAGAVVAYLAIFVGIGALSVPGSTIETLIIRAFGTAALLLLHVILLIGPMARIDQRWLPLLYNRRHLGVTMFLLAAVHGVFSLIQFHALGDTNPIVSVLFSNGSFGDLERFPFQMLGFFALLWFFLMAATSHDFWLANLSAPIWKALHMGVYLAYLLVVAHVALGALQDGGQPVLRWVLLLGFAAVAVLHLLAARLEVASDRETTADADWLDLCALGEIPLERARIFPVGGERVAVFRYTETADDGTEVQRVAAVSNVCQHQNGPLGEGRVIDGCITCPWHGYQYRPEDGSSPPPFTEKIPTFRVQLRDGRVSIDPRPLPPGTETEPAPVPVDHAATAATTEQPTALFVGYLPERPPGLTSFLARRSLAIGASALALGFGIAFTQNHLDPGTFEFGTLSTVEGTLQQIDGIPVLAVQASTSSEVLVDRHLLVDFGKFGAGDSTSDFLGQRVRLTGTWIWGSGRSMLELAEAPLPVPGQDLPSAPASPETREVTLRGEIVDSKCYLGVMKPGRGVVHHDCAVRCISGGVPPALRVQHDDGGVDVLLLTQRDGKPFGPELLDLVAVPVEVTGTQLDHDGLLHLRTTLEEIVRD